MGLVRLRRSLLLVPGSAPEGIAAAAATAVDGVILDLEDAVAEGQKPQAREWVVAALRRADFHGRERIVRVNPLDSPYGAPDVAAVVPVAPDALLLPKVSSPATVARVDREMARLEREAGLGPGTIRLHVLIETVAGVLGVEVVARSSPRITALHFGAVGLARESRGRLGPGRAAELYPLSRVLFGARGAGLDAIDTPYPDLRDVPGLEAHARIAAELGYDGKVVIHPEQVDAVNRLFTPSWETVARARRLLAAYERAEVAGAGTVVLDGGLVDAAHVQMARETLARARLAGVG